MERSIINENNHNCLSKQLVVKNNYNECLTNLACSIRKYFNLKYNHKTLEYIDKILEDNKPQNVVMILFDGMGNNILERALSKEAFLLKKRIKSITTVFPATTVSATTSITTGLNPIETGMLGWYMYYKGIDKTITTFLNCEKGDVTETPLKEAIDYKNKHMKTKTIMSDINDEGIYKGYSLFPFGNDPYQNIEDMINRIEQICSTDGKKYIYAYDCEPDNSMHLLGSDSKTVYDLIKTRNDLVEKLSRRLKNTVIIVTADHGHINVDNIHLENYPMIVNCLEKTTSLEPRAVSFHIKKSKKEEFKELFNSQFSNDFDLYTKEEVINSELFGNGEENTVFEYSLGDFLAIAKTNKAILYEEDDELKSHHAGYTEDEIYVPLIVIK